MRVCILGNNSGDSQISLFSWLYEENDVEEITFIKNKMQYVELIKRDPPDVVFIILSSIQPIGLSILENIDRDAESTEVVFISDSDDYAMDAYKVGASGYLIEPIERHKFERCFSKLHNVSK